MWCIGDGDVAPTTLRPILKRLSYLQGHDTRTLQAYLGLKSIQHGALHGVVTDTIQQRLTLGGRSDLAPTKASVTINC